MVRAARIAASAHGGQILASEATKIHAESRLRSEGITFKCLGRLLLKKAPERIPVFQVLAEGLQAEYPPIGDERSTVTAPALRPAGTKTVLLLGAGELGKNMALALREHLSNKVIILGVDRYAHPPAWGSLSAEVTTIPAWGKEADDEQIVSYVRDTQPDFVLPELELQPEVYRRIQALGAKVYPAPELIERLLDRVNFRREFEGRLAQLRELGVDRPEWREVRLGEDPDKNQERVWAAVQSIRDQTKASKCIVKPAITCLGAGQTMVEEHADVGAALDAVAEHARVDRPQILIEEFVDGQNDSLGASSANKTEVFQIACKSNGQLVLYEPVEYYRECQAPRLEAAWNLEESWHPSKLPIDIQRRIKEASRWIVEAVLRQDAFYGIEYIVTWDSTDRCSLDEYRLYLNEVTFRPDDMAMLTKYSQHNMSEFDIYVRLALGLGIPTQLDLPTPTVCRAIYPRTRKEAYRMYLDPYRAKGALSLADASGHPPRNRDTQIPADVWCEFFEKGGERYHGERFGMVYVRESPSARRKHIPITDLSARIDAMRAEAEAVALHCQKAVIQRSEEDAR